MYTHPYRSGEQTDEEGTTFGAALEAAYLGQYEAALAREGYFVATDLADADEGDLAELVAKLHMKKPDEKRLRKLARDSDPPEPEPEPEPEVIEKPCMTEFCLHFRHLRCAQPCL